MRTKARYRRLAHEIAAEEMERQAREACQRVSGLLESYVDAELSGEDARAMYPRVWDHLQECARCREAYQILLSDTED